MFNLIKNYLFNKFFKPREIKNVKIDVKQDKNMINLKLVRIALKDTYTVGNLFLNDGFFCNTLEDKFRDLSKEIKIPKETAIPCGIYKINLTFSNRFQRILPELLNVPYFTSIRIHNGNTKLDTEGCILIGENKIKGGVINSKETLDKLMRILNDKQEIRIEIL